MISNYNKAVFDVVDMEQGLGMALSPNDKLSTKERDAKETPVLIDMIKQLDFDKSGFIVDFGSGTGRLAKEMVNLGYDVIGVDISPSMRHLSVEYVNNQDKFIAVSPTQFQKLIDHGLKGKCTGAYSIWCLQHINDVESSIKLLANALKPSANVFICNAAKTRFVPSDVEKEVKDSSGNISKIISHEFVDDGVNIFALMSEYFTRGRKFTYTKELGYEPDLVACYHYIKM